MEPLNALSLAAAVVRFTNVGDQLMTLATQSPQRKVLDSEEFEQVLNCLVDLKALSTFDVQSFAGRGDQQIIPGVESAEQVSIASTIQIMPPSSSTIIQPSTY